MAQQNQVVTLVNYDYSDESSDGLSQIESADGQAFVIASAQIQPPPIEIIEIFDSDNEQQFPNSPAPSSQQITENQSSSVSECDTDSDSVSYSDSESDSSSSDEHNTSDEPPLAKKARADLVVVSSSSDGEREELQQQQQQESDGSPQTSARKPYALRPDDLPADLRAFLRLTRSFFTRPHSLERVAACVGVSTYEKAEERLLCFLGHAAQKPASTKDLTPEVFADRKIIESYLDYLREVRLLSPATISNHVSSLLYPLKYMHRRQAPRYDSAPIIAQLRRTATLLQREGEVQRPKTREELKALNRWLDWEEVLDALQTQRMRLQVARTKRHQAREAADLLLLSLYCHIPPSRGLEIRTLEVVQEVELASAFTAQEFRNRNVVLMRQSGACTIHVQLYKTSKFTGHDQIELEVGSELCRLLRQYVQEYRAELCGPETVGCYLFLNANGQPFSCGAFSRHMRSLLLKLTGQGVSINGLRSSFLTWAYSRSDCDDQMKDSLAAALRHSRAQAQTTYDRRTANEKKALAVELAQSRAAEEDRGPSSPETEDDSQRGHRVGDFVGLVEDSSTLQWPRVLLGRIHSFLEDDQVSLLWYKSAGPSLFSLEVDGSQWVESVESLVPVSVKPAKGHPNSFRLCTSLRTVHKAVHGGRQS